ncbi:vacuolar iron transporter homolog 2 [Selaginella moellendorffii]|uniref:vacuolar iron transporter homolog 2 n=1 Tax=Selaginella moellendorffii TaxID=88036 RepID=UPI000D1C34F4|nr:vacuolar iron transporter homolog 2 [Selaginella moellendorffii]|eukprot:XP_024519692.1 vacuolar iron transporter homolog 2 [Selaginella moellendorffii]
MVRGGDHHSTTTTTTGMAMVAAAEHHLSLCTLDSQPPTPQSHASQSHTLSLSSLSHHQALAAVAAVAAAPGVPGGGGGGVPGLPILLHSSSGDPLRQEEDGHDTHYSQRSPWLRAMVLGANDGLISVASIMVGVSAVKYDVKASLLSGIAGLIAGACSMAIGEFVSVYSQRDTELADLEKEKQEHMAGPERELEELAQIYVSRGLSYYLAKQVAEELSSHADGALKAHARDELGIDLDGLSNPMQAATASALAFSVGGAVPLLAGAFVGTYKYRLTALLVSSTAALAAFGALGARLGGAAMGKAALRVTLGGWAAMLVTYGFLFFVSRYIGP